MKILVLEGIVRCGHDGSVQNVASQEWVRVDTSPVLVESDPQGRSISGCPNVSVNFKPCQNTLVVGIGYSIFVRIGGHAICLDSIQGFTDGTPPGLVRYDVRDPGQAYVAAAA